MKKLLLKMSESVINRSKSSFNRNSIKDLIEEKLTKIEEIELNGFNFLKYSGELWTSKQRQNNPIHEISYRACFKPELPRFFINLFTVEGDLVYDPFAGRGTTIIEAALLRRKIISNDINPLSRILTEPRLNIPELADIENRLELLKFKKNIKADIDLSMFYHPVTESEIISLSKYLIERNKLNKEDYIDKWIRMVATNRLTGHSKNFFSVYTLPPNQAVSPQRQIRINQLRNQKPEYKDVKKIILKKSRDLIKGINSELANRLRTIGNKSAFYSDDARYTVKIKSNSVNLVVTSPPFLNIVNYEYDNWLRCWFNDINSDDIAEKITSLQKISDWEFVMGEVFKELYRITKPNGKVAFEVGEVRKGKLNLDEHIVPIGIKTGFDCIGILVNLQSFTKTANIWGIKNNQVGTNTNRIVLFRKP